MAGRLRLETRVSTKTELRSIVIKVAIGGLALSSVIFCGVFIFNYLGIQMSSKAEERSSSKYPFDLNSDVLKNVNFTVLPGTVNSEFEEVRPMISGDGNHLFFSRRNHPGNFMKKKDAQDIWISTLQTDGKWGPATNPGSPINGLTADAICSVNADGSEIFFIHEEMEGIQPLMRTQRTPAGWTAPQPQEIEDFYNKIRYIDIFYSHEANVLLMALNRDDTRGEQDLYVSFPAGENKWSAPLNLGPLVNSFEADFAPFLSADGRTLYFASYGHKGLGGCDIFQTTRLDDTWQRWSKPQNLGEGINSPREESYFSITKNNQHIYFESYDDKNGVRDIFRADVPDEVKPGLLQQIITNDRSRNQ
jgi:OmpA-OmpF porin, OOP family